MRKRADLVYCYSKITVLLYQLTEKSIQSGDITQKKCPSCLELNVDFSISVHCPAQTLTTSTPRAPSPPRPPCLAVYRGLCGSDCGAPLQEFGSGRGLESRPTLSPIQRPARCEVGKFQSAIQLNGPHKGDYKPQRIPVGTWERRRCERDRGNPSEE